MLINLYVRPFAYVHIFTGISLAIAINGQGQ